MVAVRSLWLAQAGLSGSAPVNALLLPLPFLACAERSDCRVRCNPGEGGLQLDPPCCRGPFLRREPQKGIHAARAARLLPPGSGSGSAGWPCIASDVEVQPWARRAPDWNLLGEINELENSEDRRSVGRRGNQHVRLRITQVTSRRPACSDAPIEPRQAPLLCCKQSSQRSRFLLIENQGRLFSGLLADRSWILNRPPPPGRRYSIAAAAASRATTGKRARPSEREASGSARLLRNVDFTDRRKASKRKENGRCAGTVLLLGDVLCPAARRTP